MNHKITRVRQTERGATLVEFSISVLVFLTALFGVLETARMLWTYNAIADGVRQGARYAAMHSPGATTAVKNVVLFGTDTPATATPIVYGLNASHITVTYSETPALGVRRGAVAVRVSGFIFSFLVLPNVFGNSLTFPSYEVSMTGESAGFVPPTI